MNNDQIQSTHTIAKYGNINETFSAEVHIDVAQQNYMIAHIKLGRLQLAVQSIIFVTEYCKVYLHYHTLLLQIVEYFQHLCTTFYIC